MFWHTHFRVCVRACGKKRLFALVQEEKREYKHQVLHMRNKQERERTSDIIGYNIKATW